MASLPVPLSVVIVTHHVDVVEVLVQLGNVVGDVDGGSGCADGSGQKEVVLVESGSEVLHQGHEVLLVLGLSSPLA